MPRGPPDVLDPLRMLRNALKLSKVTTDFDAKSRVFNCYSFPINFFIK